jgi:hypothetical protein
MNRLIKRWAARSLPLLLALVPTAATAQQNVTLSASNGSLASTDWLVHPNPLLVVPGQPGSSVIAIDPTYRDFSDIPRLYTGRLSLSVSCCRIRGAEGWVGPGINIGIGPLEPRFLALGREPPAGLGTALGRNGLTLSSSSVDVAGQPTMVRLDATAGPVSDLVPGNFLVLIRADDPLQQVRSFLSLLINVLPPWPPDGPAPSCIPGLQVLPLSSLPGPSSGLANVYAWKARNPAKTSFRFAAADPVRPIGLQVTVRDEGLSPPLAPDRAIIRFTNAEGWRVGIRSSDSRNCAAPGPLLLAEAGGAPATFTISTADTTTLVFSRSVCRAFFIFCWGQLGHEDVLQFSEGAFWTLFGGRAVDIQTVGRWDRAINPFDGVATLTVETP